MIVNFFIGGEKLNRNNFKENKTQRVPKVLRRWFVIHFIIDIVVATPLFIAPNIFLDYFGWQQVDPLSTRLFAAALFGIGIESFLSRNGNFKTFNHMLNLKIIWSLFASVGIFISIIQSYLYNNIVAWISLIIFILFNVLWVYWKFSLRKFK